MMGCNVRRCHKITTKYTGPHALAVATIQPGTAGTQYVFVSWSDGGAVSHTITISNTPATYAASLKTQYQLALSVSPAGAGTFTPVSGRFYDSGSVNTS